MISIMNLMNYGDNGSPSRSKFTLKTRFLAILGHALSRMVSQYDDISSKLCQRLILESKTIRFLQN